MTAPMAAVESAEPVDVRQTPCCIVGGGPAGMVLAYLLARRGVAVTLLESHPDFDRDFRGDTVHPSTLEIMQQLGLADRLLAIPHGKVRSLKIVTPEASFVMADLARLRTPFPYVAMLPQAQFLDFLAGEGRKLPGFELILTANVQRLVEEGGVVRGVRYRGSDGAWHEVRAPLTVAADGRFSKVRSLAGLEPMRTAPPMDVVWFRLPRRPEDEHDTGAIYIHGGRFAVLLERAAEWQVGYAILKGGYQQLRAEGIEELRQNLIQLVPWLAGRADQLRDWKQVAVLSVESSRLACWHKPGLLCIGDAAHAMSPVGGVGINYAIQDAVETSNLLAEVLRTGQVAQEHLDAVQKRRERPTRAIQAFQGMIQRRIAAPALQAGKPFRLPWMIRLLLALPWIRSFPARMIAFGIRRVSVEGIDRQPIG